MRQALGEYESERSDKSLRKCSSQSDGDLPGKLQGHRQEGKVYLKFVPASSLTGMCAGLGLGSALLALVFSSL